MPIQAATVLFLSNGHGEDTVGAALAAQVQSQAGERARIVAWPVVGEGRPYTKAGISVIGPRGDLPSGGFGYLSLAAQLRDVLSGGLVLALRQLAFAWRQRRSFDAVVGVGDRVSLEVNHFILKRPMVWVAIADSVRYLPPGREAGNPTMWKAMRAWCREVFTRDAETRDSLQRLGIGATYLGNPMMDLLPPAAHTSTEDLHSIFEREGVSDEGPLVVLLPGSRQDAYLNLPDQLEACKHLSGLFDGRLRAAVAWAGGLPVNDLAGSLAARGWQFAAADATASGVAGWATSGHANTSISVPVLMGLFGDLVRAADVVIGQAGTAVEQAAGLGKPVIAFASRGSQVTPRFLGGQKQILGEAILVTEPDPEAVAQAVYSVLSDPEKRARMAAEGMERMGAPGALAGIAQRIVEVLIP